MYPKQFSSPCRMATRLTKHITTQICQYEFFMYKIAVPKPKTSIDKLIKKNES